MITPQTIRNILYLDCQALGIKEIYAVIGGTSDDIPSGEVRSERVVIHVREQKPGTYWHKSFNEINILVPRVQGRENSIRLEELEQKAMSIFEYVVGSYGNITYSYSIVSIGTKTDEALRCEYLNARILFEVLNVK